ncbi:MAG: glutamate synthase-related protein, partial [Chloroflexota bacterium]
IQSKLTQNSLYRPEFEHDACGVGFIARTTGEADHDIIEMALESIRCMKHRAGIDADGLSGDGAGVLTQIPHNLLANEIENLPAPGDYGVGVLFLPKDFEAAQATVQNFLDQFSTPALQVTWRAVPINDDALGSTAYRTRPAIHQIIVERPDHIDRGAEFDRFLFTLRHYLERVIQTIDGFQEFYVVSLSAHTLVYKGLMLSPYLADFYLDLANPAFESAFALVHTRYSTNTAPSWQRAQPLRMLAHNGEINTVQGNVNWMKARESTLKSPFWPDDLADIRPLIDLEGSDSAMLDNVLELLTWGGRKVHHNIAMLVPEAWENMGDIYPGRRDFYRYHAGLMEPWDGPAALVFTDGQRIGAALDRNGLRPMRFLTTNTDLIIASSEAGTVDIDESIITAKGKLGPGQMILVDLTRNLFLTNDHVKNELAQASPYQTWVQGFKPLPTESRSVYSVLQQRQRWPFQPKVDVNPQWIARLQAAFGYTNEDITAIVRPMANDGKEPTGSMGDDTPLAVFSPNPRPLFHYFKQRFAQVTNPPIDPLRETFVMSLITRLGARSNLLESTANHAHLVELASPVLTDTDLLSLKGLGDPRFQTHTIPMRYPIAHRAEGLRRALTQLNNMAERAIDQGRTILILSDLGVNQDYAPIPSLLAVGSVHHHLVRQGKRMRASLVIETAEVREVHHLACLIGYGANAVNPYLALATIARLVEANKVKLDVAEAKLNFIRAIEAGVLKIMSKMGISTIESYCGAQIFEAVGLDTTLVDEFFAGTVSRLGGIGLTEIHAEVQRWHTVGFSDPQKAAVQSYGFYKFKRGGEPHAYDPPMVRALHKAVRLENVLTAESAATTTYHSGKHGEDYHTQAFVGENFPAGYDAYKEFVALTDRDNLINPRDMLGFVETGRQPLSLDEIEPIEAIFTRFSTGAMSHGALSSESHETLAIALNRLGAMSNSGEGGSAQERFGNEKNDRIKQIASGRFGVTPAYLMSADELQIKMAQGAKPGEGGQLPGHKVTAEIAAIRHATIGTTLISPPPHHDIYSIEDLAQLIYDLKQVNPTADISVKLVAEAGVGTVAAGVAKGGAAIVHISGHSGGTGAAAWSSIKNVGLPWEVGLAETHQTLQLNNLRDRVRVRADGGLQTARDVIVAAMLGADEYSFGTSALVAEGCLMARACHNNTCPVGVATQSPKLRAKFAGTPEHVMTYLHYVAQEIREILASLGFSRLEEIVGRTDLLRQISLDNPAVDSLDLSPLLAQVTPLDTGDNSVDDSLWRVGDLNKQLLTDAQPALEQKTACQLTYPITPTDRTVGTTLAGTIAQHYGDQGLCPSDLISVTFEGSAGQSFGAFNIKGMQLTLIGEANDYVGKGMNGGQIIVRPAANSSLVASDNVIIGNTVLYGATGGSLFACGQAGERFAVRNSGATAVVEGVGDHGCEYMVGGTVVVLGQTGYNFGAGMSGGMAFVLDLNTQLPRRINPDMIDVARLRDSQDIDQLYNLITCHVQLTGSLQGQAVLDRWEECLNLFWKVAPKGMVEKSEIPEASPPASKLSQHVVG